MRVCHVYINSRDLYSASLRDYYSEANEKLMTDICISFTRMHTHTYITYVAIFQHNDGTDPFRQMQTHGISRVLQLYFN